MTQHRTGQRRGLGRGLGSLIPTAPPAERGSAAAEAEATSQGSSDVEVGPASSGTNGDGAGKPAPHGRRDGASGGDGLAPVNGAYFAELDITAVTPNPRQPRQVFEEEALAELVHSVKEVGLLQPVVVRRVGESSYELIMGERRWRAMQQAGLSTIPAIVRDTSDDDMLRDALLENLHRSQLNPLEEAAAYQQLLDDFGCTHEELATRIGRSRPQISNTLRLLKLSPAVQRRVAAGVLSAGHARALLGVASAETQDRLAGRVVSEGISVRGLEEIVAVGDLGSEQKARPRPRKPHAPALDDLSARLSDRLETRVKVALGKSKGKITVEFASIPDLERIVEILDPNES
jgi:ParB family chromosome partitioning protein